MAPCGRMMRIKQLCVGLLGMCVCHIIQEAHWRMGKIPYQVHLKREVDIYQF